MSAQAKPLRVGLFVIGAVALILGGLVAFGSADLFRTRYQFVGFFPGSVAGLRAGAPVSLRGVPVGQVTRIVAQYDPSDMSTRVAVYFEAIEGSVDNGGQVGPENAAEEFRRLIEAGLRAQLVPQSFVTGQLFIQLQMRPDSEANLVGGVEPGVVEVPTIPSTIDVLDTQLKSILGVGEGGGLHSLVDDLDRIASPENAEALTRILQNVADFSAKIIDRQAQIGVMIEDAQRVVGRADAMLEEGEALVGDTRSTVGSLSALATDLDDPDTGVAPTLTIAREMAASIGRTADQINNFVAENRAGVSDFSEVTLPAVDDLVLDLERLVQTLNRVAEQLERDPSGFLLGRGQREGIQQ